MGHSAGESMNLKELAQNLEMEEAEFLDMMKLFLETALSDLGDLQLAWEKGDAIETARAAHSIKGAAVNLGLTEIYEIATIIEMEAHSNRLDRVREWIRTLRTELDRMAKVLEVGKQ
jgi:HPt (histidine-containing phosphotransfer) domain-containing protein